jgi:hypothetical protein
MTSLGSKEKEKWAHQYFFSKFIEHGAKKKYALLYDIDGSRYVIMTTSFAEVYNWVVRGVRGLPLMTIMKFIVHGTNKYLRG